MDINVVKNKVHRMVNEFFDESGFLKTIGRDGDGDLVLEMNWRGNVKCWVTVEEIVRFETLDKTWVDLDLPNFSVTFDTVVAIDLKPCAALNKYVLDEVNERVFTTPYLDLEEDKTQTLRLRSVIAADTLDTCELRNALIHLIRDFQYLRDGIPKSALINSN
jgi:hypothetical protein